MADEAVRLYMLTESIILGDKSRGGAISILVVWPLKSVGGRGSLECRPFMDARGNVTRHQSTPLSLCLPWWYSFQSFLFFLYCRPTFIFIKIIHVIYISLPFSFVLCFIYFFQKFPSFLLFFFPSFSSLHSNLLSLFLKIKGGLWDHLALCVSVCVCPSVCVSPPLIF
jgi:hypothetical protein